jgi:hypothetical protein
MKKLLTLIALLTLLTGCAAPGPKYSIEAPAEGEALVYVYRVWRFANGGGSPTIALNGREMDDLENGRFLQFRVPPGKHKVEQLTSVWSWSLEAPPVMVDAYPGQIYYIELETDATMSYNGAGFTKTSTVLFQEVPGSVALPKLKSLRAVR